MDIRQLTAGATLYLPVDVAGGLFSAGDGHFAQGDGETCGTAIETAARFTLHGGEAERRGQQNPTFTSPLVETPAGLTGEFYATTGLSVSDDGVVSPLDAGLAARNALLQMMDALSADHGLTREQTYIVASVAGQLRVSSIVNVPHAQVSMFVPTGIFE